MWVGTAVGGYCFRIRCDRIPYELMSLIDVYRNFTISPSLHLVSDHWSPNIFDNLFLSNLFCDCHLQYNSANHSEYGQEQNDEEKDVKPEQWTTDDDATVEQKLLKTTLNPGFLSHVFLTLAQGPFLQHCHPEQEECLLY